jgi:hypothetical protein
MPLTQPIPQVTPVDVERVVRRDFSDDDYATVMTILNDYGRENWHRERTRVQLAALKVANANVQKRRACIESANRDYRDALAAAEYPAYCKMAWGQDLPAKKKVASLKVIGGNTRCG